MIMDKDHTVLIVDDEAQIGRVVARLLNGIDVASVYVSDGAQGLEELKKSSKPFSLIIADQNMPGMSGTDFLEQASLITPDTTRFLITGHTDLNAMIDAVNRGGIHKYIAKPWNNEDFLKYIQEGLSQYELAVENIGLFRLAKQQNSKLFELNRILNESAEKQAKILEDLDATIVAAQSQSHIGKAEDLEVTRELLKALLQKRGLVEYDKMNCFYRILLNELAYRFQKDPLKCGIELQHAYGGEDGG